MSGELAITDGAKPVFLHPWCALWFSGDAMRSLSKPAKLKTRHHEETFQSSAWGNTKNVRLPGNSKHI